MLTLCNFLPPSLKAGFLKHPGLEPQRDLAHFAVSEQGKARPEAKASEAIPGPHHQPREEEILQSGGILKIRPGGGAGWGCGGWGRLLPVKECFE